MNAISEVIEKIKKMKGIKTKEKVYELLGTTRNSIFNRQRRNKFPYQEIVTYCLRENMDINEILTNQSSAAQPKIRPIRSGTIPTEQVQSSDQEGYVFVPKYDVQVSARQGSLIHSKQIESGNINIINILLRYGANPNIPAGDGFTPLMGAVLNDNIAIAKELLLHGALLNQHDKNGETPYYIARDSGNKMMLSMLAEYE